MKVIVIKNTGSNFKEVIRGTGQEKLWLFLIDNEMGMEEKKKYSLADHIFSERHLTG